MESNKINLMDRIPERQITNTIKMALKNGPIFGMQKSINVINVVIENKSLVVNYVPEVKNKISVYEDITQIMGFITAFIGADLETKRIYTLGVQAIVDRKPYIYVVSPIVVAKEIGKGNIIYWMNNSIISESFTAQKEIFFMVEGPTELNAYPILFKSMGFNINANRINIISYSNMNLRSLLWISKYKSDLYYLVCDNDKSQEISDLNKEGFFEYNNYHILKKGEFEDYVTSEALVQILERMNPGIGISIEYLDENRCNGKPTSKIITDYYYTRAEMFKFPGKPALGEEIANFWAQNGIPDEIKQIILDVMNIT